MSPRSRSGRHALVAATTAAVALLAAIAPACSSDGSDDSSAPSTTAASTTTISAAPTLPEDVTLPIVFVHGFAGSAQQYESQAMRFVANGYPADRIIAYDHDGAGLDFPAYVEGLTEVVDDALATFDVDQIYLVGHSRGTTVSTTFLGDEANAAKVAKYVAIDGQPCPDAVPCLAPTQEMFPGQAHVEVATSPESFAAQYEFLVGEAPDVVDIEREGDTIEISGRAVIFPANTGRDGTTLSIWEVDAATGHRVDDEPIEEVVLPEDGSYGPFEIEAGTHYEYALSAPDTDVVHHLYPQPYLRSTRLMRLLSSEPDGDVRSNTNLGDDHTALIAIRMREWYATGDAADQLLLGVDGEDAVDVIADFVGNGAIGLHLHDDAATPGETTLEALPYFSEQPFQSGVDVFLPASADGEGTITVTNVPRGDESDPQVVNVPNWPSSDHAVSVVFTDWPVDGSA